MPSLDKRMTKMEETVENHLIESGQIRADLKWLKKLTWFILGSPFVIEAVKHVHLAGK
jgi:hypothetical protein